MRVDCPICGRYAPEIRRLIDEFTGRGVRFWLVYPEPDDTASAIRKHLADFDLPEAALRDPTHSLVRRSGATVTPEVAVFVSDVAEPVYLGRIDDLYESYGVHRAVAQHHDLEAALEAVVANVRPPTARTKAVGCYISERQ
jgi:hypothetical protein